MYLFEFSPVDSFGPAATWTICSLPSALMCPFFSVLVSVFCVYSHNHHAHLSSADLTFYVLCCFFNVVILVSMVTSSLASASWTMVCMSYWCSSDTSGVAIVSIRSGLCFHIGIELFAAPQILSSLWLRFPLSRVGLGLLFNSVSLAFSELLFELAVNFFKCICTLITNWIIQSLFLNVSLFS